MRLGLRIFGTYGGQTLGSDSERERSLTVIATPNRERPARGNLLNEAYVQKLPDNFVRGGAL
jgi:hypothetical protein